MRCFKFFWTWFHKRYAKENVGKISIPAEFLGRFDWHYFVYDEDGMVFDGASNMFSAISKAKKTKCYVTRVWD